MEFARITMFSKGIIRAASEEDAPKDSLYYALNVRFSPIGCVSRRTGARRHLPTQVSTSILTSIHIMSFWPGDTVLFVSDGSTRYYKRIGGTSGEFSVCTTGYNLGSKWRGFCVGNMAYWQNGVDGPRKTIWANGTATESLWGVTIGSAPVSNVSATDAGLGDPIGSTYSTGSLAAKYNWYNNTLLGIGTQWRAALEGKTAGTIYVGVTEGETHGYSIVLLGTGGEQNFGDTTLEVSGGDGATWGDYTPYRIESLAPGPPLEGTVVTLQKDDTLKLAYTLKSSTYNIETNPVYGKTFGGPIGINAITMTIDAYTPGDSIYDKVVIYRSHNDGTYYKSQEYSFGSGSVTDTKPQSTLIIPMQTDTDPPPTGTVCAYWDGRAWIAGVSGRNADIVYSKPGQLEYFPTENAIRLYANSGIPRALAPMQDRLCCLTDNRLVVIRPGPTMYVADTVEGSEGCCGPDAWAVITPPGGVPLLVWLTPTRHIMAYNGVQVTLLSEKIDKLMQPPDNIISIKPSDLARAFTEIDHTHQLLKFCMISPVYPAYYHDLEIVIHYGEEGMPITIDQGPRKSSYDSFANAAYGELRFYGDDCGCLWEESDTLYCDAPLTTGTLTGTITYARIYMPQLAVIGDSTATFATAGDGQHGGCVVIKKSDGTYARHVITHNDATTFSMSGTDGAEVGNRYYIGGIPVVVATQAIGANIAGGPATYWHNRLLCVEYGTSGDHSIVKRIYPRKSGKYIGNTLSDVGIANDYFLRSIIVIGETTGRSMQR